MDLALAVSAVLLVGTASWFALLVASPGGERLGGLLQSYEAHLRIHVDLASMPIRAATLVRLQIFAVAAGFALGVWFAAFVMILVGLAAALVPPLFLRQRNRKRVERIEQQLDGWLLMLANALRATPAVGDAIASTAPLMQGDLGREVDLLVKEIKLGVPVDRALTSLAERVGSDTVAAAATTIVVARRTGGDLATALEQSASSLRESARLEGVLRTKTAEGRGQVLVLAGAPFVLCGAIAWLEPTWFDATLRHSIGRMLLIGCGVVWVVAAAWAHSIVEGSPS